MAASEATRSNLQLLLCSLACQPLTSMFNLMPDNRHLPIILPPDECYTPVEAPVTFITLSEETHSALTRFAQTTFSAQPTVSVSKTGIRLKTISLGTWVYKPWYNAPGIV